MSSGIVQLIAIGAQDEHIMGEPEISFLRQRLNDILTFHNPLKNKLFRGAKSNSMSSIRFDRTGDMLGYTYLTIDNNTQALDIQRWDTLIDKVELIIGGQVIDTQDAVFTEKIAIDTFATNVSKSANGTHPGVSAIVLYPFRFFL